MTSHNSTIQLRPGRWHPAIRFIVLFVISLVIMSLLFSAASAIFHEQMVSFMALTAGIVGGVLDMGGMDIDYHDRYIAARSITIEIIEECTGLYEIVIFIAAVLAYPATRREKVIGFIGGMVALYALNIIRMVLLVMVGNARPDWFDFFHIYFWQVTMILMITSVWLLWIIKVVKNDSRAGLTGP
ncbi:archaeosortase/exosortase family protein [Candidatus Zixiibacteriota bacterium]